MADRPPEADHVREAEGSEADEHDVLTRHREEVVEARRLERLAELWIDSLVGAEHHPGDERAALARCPEREGIPDRRAQPVAGASDPAPPADDAPGATRVKDDVDPSPFEPASLVESGLGPSRGDRARPELEHGTLRRRAPRRQFQQDPLAQGDSVETTYLGRRRAWQTETETPPR